MKETQLRQIIREELQKLNESSETVKIKDIPKVLKRKDLVYNLFGGPDNITLKPSMVDWIVSHDNITTYKKIQQLLGSHKVKEPEYEVYISYDEADRDDFASLEYNWAHVMVEFKKDTISITEFEKIDKYMKELHKKMMDIIKRYAEHYK